jgi:hypothetical protein
MEQQTFSYIVSFFLIQLFFSFFLFFLKLYAFSRSFFYTTTRSKALRKPTEQPIEQRYASLIGKVPIKYLSKGCGYGFQKMIEKYTMWTQYKKEVSKKDSPNNTATPKLGKTWIANTHQNSSILQSGAGTVCYDRMRRYGGTTGHADSHARGQTKISNSLICSVNSVRAIPDTNSN